MYKKKGFSPLNQKPDNGINLFLHLKTNLLLNKNNQITKFIGYENNNKIVDNFIDAVTSKSVDEAKLYLSKQIKILGEININELQEVFTHNNYKYLDKARFLQTPEGYKTNSILVMGKESGNNSIIHVHMVKEPDLYGIWKICGIEKE